jgi:predicted metal-dependent hydrolase
MKVRTPDIAPEEGPLVWSRIPEFAMAYNCYSAIIPYVEYYLNTVMNRIRREACADDPVLAQTLATFVAQETHHSKYHVRFNQRMFDENIEGLKELVDRMVADLREQQREKSLAWNAAYCAGFESIATYDAQYLYEECDAFFEGADPHGANLLLWHVAEEYEHRAVCHDAFQKISGSWFLRIRVLLYAFWHIGAAFVQAESLVLAHYRKGFTPEQRRASEKQSKTLFWRQLRYVAPRMLKILSPRYHPARLSVPPRIEAALTAFQSSAPLRERVNRTFAKAA